MGRSCWLWEASSYRKKTVFHSSDVLKSFPSIESENRIGMVFRLIDSNRNGFDSKNGAASEFLNVFFDFLIGKSNRIEMVFRFNRLIEIESKRFRF